LQLGASNYELFFSGSEQIDFPSKLVPCISLAWICHILVLDSHVKTMGPIYVWLSSNRIALFHWTLDRDLKWTWLACYLLLLCFRNK
jgi:hypothetical protein